MPAEGCYVYGVVNRCSDQELTVPDGGLRGAPVTAVECGPVMAVTSQLAGGRVRPSRADLSAHQRVVEHVASYTTILPMQFGACWLNEEALLDEFLRPHRDGLVHALDALAGKHEHRLKASYRGDTALREAVAASPAIRRLQQRIRRGGTAATYGTRIELGELVYGEIDRIRAADTDVILRRLEPYADLSVKLPTRKEDVVLHAGFLVDGKRQDKFDRALDSLADDLGARMSFALIGPLPPWDFVADGWDSPSESEARRSS
jgi:hypothetical protein